MSRKFPKVAVLALSALTAATAAADNGSPAFGPGDIGANGVTASPSSSLAWSNQLVTVDATTGAARATIPFELPTARGSVQPHLALNYSSDAGDGEAGAGWHLSLPSIERRGPSGGPSPTYVDQDPNLPTQDWDHFDTFVYNGQPLVPICPIRAGTCGSAAAGEVFPPFPASAGSGEWSYYRLQVDDGSAMRFFLSPNRLTWLVQVPRSGETLEFGIPLDGHNLGAPIDFGDATHAYRWHLSRQYDNQRSTTGPTNTIIYLWANGVLSDVFDTPPTSTAAFSVDSFAHHTHLWYRKNARFPSTAPPWRWLPDHTLNHVDISSMRWKNAGPRELVRRYNLSYTNNSAVSDTVWGNHPTLSSVQLEGRCAAGPILEVPLPTTAPATWNALPDADPGCSTLPATTMIYTPEPPTLEPANVMTNGHGIAVDWKQINQDDHAWVARPTVIADFNQDGYADVLVPPEDGSSQQKLYMNSRGTGLNVQTATTPSSPPVTFANGQYLAPGMQPSGNWFGDGQINVLASNTVPWHRDPYSGDSQKSQDPPSWLTADLFSLKFGTSSSTWIGQNNTAPQWNFRFQNNPAAMLIAGCDPVDINGDGLTDCWVQEDHWQGDDSTSSFTWIGEGVYFTTQDRTGAITPPFGTIFNLAPTDANGGGMIGLEGVASNTPMRDARLWAASQGAQGDPIQSLPYYWADMDGDGLVDVVFPKGGQLTYWRGNGQGWFGDGTCVPATAGPPVCSYGKGGHGVPMGSLPPGNDSKDNVVYFHDLNGDGYSDYIVTNGTGITIYFNIGGAGFDSDWTIFIPEDGTPGSTGGQLPGWWFEHGGRLAFADMDGSGVDDLVLLGSEVAYFELAHHAVPDKLIGITNGLGATEAITYVRDSIFVPVGAPIWQTKQIVRSVEVTNGLSGTAADMGRTQIYDYTSPIFDVRSRSLRGFNHVNVTTAGGTGAPGSQVATDYLISATPGGIATDASATGVDDIYSTFHGLPLYQTISDDQVTTFKSSVHTQYQVRRLYAGEDGRIVRLVFPEQTDTILYDTSGSFSPGAPATFLDVDAIAVADSALVRQSQHAPAATAGAALLRSSVELDDRGNTTFRTNYGRVSSGFGITVTGATDTPIAITSDFSTPVGPSGSWIWKPHSVTVASAATSAEPAFSRSESFQYDALGNQTSASTTLSGTVPLSYSHEAGKPVAPQPARMAADGPVVEYAAGPLDQYGNVTTLASANGTQCTRVTFDTTYALLPIHTSRGCSGATLDEFVLTYDLGLGKATTTSGTSNDVSTIAFDTFGRTVEIHDPDYTTPGVAYATPSVLIEYVEDTAAHVLRTHTTAYARESWAWNDAIGNELATFAVGDPTSDGAAWIANNAARFYGTGAIQTAYPPFLWTGDNPRTASVVTFSQTALTHVGQNASYDAFGRAVKVTATDGATLLQSTQFHALATVMADGEDNLAGGTHANTPTTIQRDGFGRTIGVTSLEKHSGALDQVTTATTYLPTGELDTVTLSHSSGTDSFVRHNTYDSMGRMVQTTEPNSDVPPMATGHTESKLATWTYAYDYAGNLVGTNDARGCGKNILYDNLGRTLAYDFSPCLSAQADYTPALANGDGTEAFFIYDHADTGQLLSPIQTAAAEGRLAAIYDQAAHTQFAYDSRGHAVQVTRQIAAPSGTSALATRYTTATFTKSYTYDPGAALLTAETTGANDPSLLVNGKSAIGYGYSASGHLAAVAGSYGQLLSLVTYDPAGRRLTTWYGDAASTTKAAHYTAAGLLDSLLVSRAAGPWAKQTSTYTPPSSSLGPTSLQQVLIHDSLGYDQAGNPTSVTDMRGAEWPSGAKPVSRSFVYDDAYRLTQAKYNSGGDITGMPVAGEPNAMPMLKPPSRVKEQDFLYDWMGNTTSSTSDDDVDGFFDRSIGTITNGNAGKNPNQLSSATGLGGTLSAAYDAAGNMVSLLVVRTGVCTDPSGECTMRFAYDWDEINRLNRARRWNYAGAYTGPQYPSLPTTTPDVDVHYAYDAAGQRVVKSALSAPAGTGRISCGVMCQPKTSFNVDVFDSLRLNGAGWNGTAYQDDDSTETVYVTAADARVFNDWEGQMPAAASGPHVFFEVGDNLGSTAAIVDKASGELVERDTYQAYGASDSDYQPERWARFHEVFQFTSKENDSEVGLAYFGARYYSPFLGRWINPDPMTVHAMGADLNPYAYAGGNATATTDPWGMDPPPDTIFDTILPDGSAVGFSPGGGTAWEFYDAPLQNNDPASAMNCFGMSCHTSYAPQYDPLEPVLRQAPVSVGNGIAAVSNVVSSNLKEVGENTENLARYLGVPDFDIQLFKTMPDSPVSMAEVPVQLASIFVAMSEVKVAVTDLRVARAGYSVAAEVRLPVAVWGRSAAVHENAANAIFHNRLLVDPEYRGVMEELIPGVTEDVSQVGGRSTPAGWLWHHEKDSGLMRLVPDAQHTPGSEFFNVMHPDGSGGYAGWARAFGAPLR